MSSLNYRGIAHAAKQGWLRYPLACGGAYSVTRSARLTPVVLTS
jgi:hypothetical protein